MPNPSPGGQALRTLLPFALLVAIALLTSDEWLGAGGSDKVPYSELLTSIEAGNVQEVEIGPDEVIATLRAEAGQRAKALRAERVPGIDDPALLEALREHGVKTVGRPQKSGWFW